MSDLLDIDLWVRKLLFLFQVNRHPYGSFFRNSIVPPSEYPFTVAISRDGTEKDMCNGVLVRENFVLTTAQCVAG